MGLSEGRVEAAIAVSDMGRAVEFYERKLGLRSERADPDADGGRTYSCGGGTAVHVFPSPSTRPSGATVAAWMVEDVEATVDELIGNGVRFEQYDDGPFATDAKGVAKLGGYVSAWVKDPDGNILGIRNG
jgi:catechol 2,3-dioxygenase-like lactoylglutathione lyase family enzyme